MRKVGVVAGGKSGKSDVAGPVTGWEDDWSTDAPVSHERPELAGEQKVKAALLEHAGQWVTLRTPAGIGPARARQIARRYLRSQPAVTARLTRTQTMPTGSFQAVAYCTAEQHWKVAARYAPTPPESADSET